MLIQSRQTNELDHEIKLRTFEMIDEFNIIGRGKVITVKTPEDFKKNSLIDTVVIISGKRYLVLGVEYTQMGDFGYGKSIGLCVREIK